MDIVHRLDDQSLADVNDFAQHTPWLHGAVFGYATYGLALFAALLMAFARVYIAAHHPWDVVAGLVFGALVALIGWALLRGMLTAITGRLRRQPGVRQVFPTPVIEPAPRVLATRGASAA